MTDMDRDPTSEAYDMLDFSPDSSGRHRFMNRRTEVMLDIANKNLGFDLVVIQGSYMLPGEAAGESEATYNSGDVIGLRTHDILSHIGTPRAVVPARDRLRGISTPAPTVQRGHIHAVATGDVQMDPTAKTQVDQYFQHRDGLGGQDKGPWVDPILISDYDTQGLDMQLTDKIPGTDDKTVGDALRAALRTEGDVERLKEVEARRAQQRAQRHQRLSQRIAAVGQSVEDLPEGDTKQQVKKLLEQMLMDAEPADDTAPTP